MLFNSYIFILLFLPITLIGFYFLSGQKRTLPALIWLITASLFFYGWWNPPYLILIIASILLNYFLGQQIVKTIGVSRKALLALGVFINLGLIAYFKYTNFFIDSLNDVVGTNYHLEKIILPLAISFFTFQQIAYLIDSFRGEVKKHSILNYSFFVTFFPQLIAGPIVHHSEMLPQIKKGIFKNDVFENISIGFCIFALGIFKKTVIADGLATYATPVFSAADAGAHITIFEAWGAAISYSLQLYFDFSGYSDMAIGIARMFGFKLPMNFYSPYKATNIIDFWRRWHITLSRFLKDYLYIPLGGNRLGSRRRYINLLITMLLGGLWHGAAWTFVVWGGLHGVYLILNHLWRDARKKLGLDSSSPNFTYKIFCGALTTLSVVIAWVFFRAETFSGSLSILSSMFGINGFEMPNDFKAWRNAEIYIPVALLIVCFMPNVMEIMSSHDPAFETYKEKSKPNFLYKIKFQINKKWALVIGFLLAVSISRMSSVSEFLYFQF